MFTGLEVSQRAYELWEKRDNIAYLYGTKGEMGTEEFIRNKFKQYPSYFSKYTSQQLEDIVKYSLGKQLFDCSGFVCYCAGIPDVYSGKLLEEGTNKTKNMKDGKAGWLCYKKGHVGIDRGDGTFLHIYKEMHTIEPVRFAEYNWTEQCRLKGVDYSYEDKQVVEDSVVTHTVKKGETLWKIAEKYYGKGSLYIKIAELNKIRGNVINVGQVLVIPKL